MKNYGQQTGFAWSNDGEKWEKSARNPVLARGPSGQWDAATASYGSVVVNADRLEMWYTGMDRDYDPPSSIPEYWEIGYASRPLEAEIAE